MSKNLQVFQDQLLMCCKSQLSWLQGITLWQVRLGASVTALWKRVTLKNPGVAVGSSQPQVIVACGSVTKGITRSLNPQKRKDTGLETLLELFTWLLGALSSTGLVSTTLEGRGKSRDVSNRLWSAPHRTWVKELNAVHLLKEKKWLNHSQVGLDLEKRSRCTKKGVSRLKASKFLSGKVPVQHLPNPRGN